MPARAFVDSDFIARQPHRGSAPSKCPQGHLLILIFEMEKSETIASLASKCPQGHLLILMGIF